MSYETMIERHAQGDWYEGLMSVGDVDVLNETTERPRSVEPCGCRHYCGVVNEDSREAIDLSVRKWLDGDLEHSDFDLMNTDWEFHRLEEAVDDRHYAIIEMIRRRRERKERSR